MFSFFKHDKDSSSELTQSALFDEASFYQAFLNDVRSCTEEVIIESPFITRSRATLFLPLFKQLVRKDVKIYIVTRNPKEHEFGMEEQSEDIISEFERIGVQVLLCIGNHHRKLAILDRKILWEGSLNILSQTQSREIMRRIDSNSLAMQMFEFLQFERVIA